METNPDLPNELVEEILSRLPGKSLMKFKCVSKLWLSLISRTDLRFIKTHLAMSSERDDCHSLILTLRPPGKDSDSHLRRCSFSSVLNVATTATTDAVVDVISYPIESPGKSMVVGSCNGLVCTCFGEKDLFVWNPCTQKYKKLPDISVQIDEDDWYYMNFGFGYDDRIEDYKVVRLFTTLTGGPESPYETEVKVYSLKKNSWSRIGDINGCTKLVNSGAYASGNLHWAADFDENGWKILSLDLTTETNGEMELPNRNWDELDWSIGVLGGSLSVVYDDGIAVIVWIMKEYGVNDSWTRVFFITGSDYSGTFRNGLSFPVCAVRDGNVLLVLLGVLVLYNPKRNTCRWYRQTSRVEHVSLFVESLVSPDLYLEEPRQL